MTPIRRRPSIAAAGGAALLCGLLVSDAIAQTVPGSHRGTCRRISRQIDQFESTLVTARERSNELWEKSTAEHLDRLYERRGTLCPEYATTRAAAIRQQNLENAAAFVKAAGSAALRFFTFGTM